MLDRYSLSLVAISSLASPALAAEPFGMLAEDTASSDPEPASSAPFQMMSSDIVYSGSESAAGETIVRNTDERLFFRDTSSAADATIILNEGGAASFEDASSGGTAELTVNGISDFSGQSSAGGAGIVVNASGVTRFSGAADAGSARVENSGRLVFEGASNAANSAITNNESGAVTFAGTSSAGGGQALTNSGTLQFTDAATAGQRFVANNETGRIAFGGQSTAGSSVIANSGSLRFADRSTLSAGRVVGNAGGTIDFSGEASAGAGEIAHAGILRFAGRSSAGSALVETQTGGTTLFVEEASGGAAEIRLQAGSALDFSGLTTRATSVGSILGSSSIRLGGTALTIGDGGPQRTAGGFSDGGAFGGTGGSLVKAGSSVLGLEGSNTYTGATEIRAGTLLGASQNAFAPRSAVTVGEGALLDIGGFDQEIGSLAGAGRVDLAANRLRLGADGRSTVFSGQFTGAGGFEKLGSGTFALTGDGEMFGASIVSGGTLQIDGAMPLLPVSVRPGATLSGAGSLGSASVAAGGAIAPRFSVLTVEGDVAFEEGSLFRVGARGGSDGGSGRLEVGGTARLGAADVSVELDRAMSFLSEQRFTILRAGSREEEFAGASLSTDSAFLTAGLEYDARSATLVVRRRETPVDMPPGTPPPVFAGATETGNQLEAARALDSLAQTGESLSLYNAVLFSNAANARLAFDQLSGEAHASTRGLLLDGGGQLRDSVLARTDAALSNVAEGADLPGAEGRFATSGPWMTGYGSFARADGGREIGRADRNLGGVVAGLDRTVAPNALIGIFGAYSYADIDVEARRSNVSIDTGHVGIYGGGALGPAELTAGTAYGHSWIDADRSVAFPGFFDRLSTGYGADTLQLYGEIATRFTLGGLEMKPFASLAYVHLDADGFQENGGAARLSVASQSSDTTFGTLGLRAGHRANLAGREIAVRGMAGWRHAEGDTRPTSTVAYVTGSPFTVSGVPIAKDTAVIEAGFSAEVAPNLTFSADYLGQFGESFAENGFRLSLAGRF